MLNRSLRGAVLADGMGLSKTLTSINVALCDPNEPYEGLVLVVALCRATKPRGIREHFITHFVKKLEAMSVSSCAKVWILHIPSAGLIRQPTITG
ncbi:hypothetical protein BDP55DRAFT_647780 [Colletotrichum godetiae]|uniref:Uncharacterized protein n=1 Tax=Colletotrichum godetiae TaxID=1209918 RepID=A0AAJ0EX39_9PEZI|nr:uncharacterized protein BDP55DRAFT_647780 [Colletotrichum godetiae]KAK1690594.1 hypothetical protein BDP55DRAFT_647780 [Colletotrichum godetiae]